MADGAYGPQLRGYQTEAARDLWRSIVSHNNPATLLVAPTGSGKTVIAAFLMQKLLQHLNWNILFLAPRREIVHQTCDKLTAAGVWPGILMAGEIKSPTRPVQVASIDSYLRWRGRKIADYAPQLVIADEAHRSLSRSMKKLLDEYRERGTKILGMTATPIRSDGQGLGRLYTNMVATPDVSDLTSMGFLVPMEYYVGIVPDTKGVKLVAGDYSQDELQRVLDQDLLVGDVVENYGRLGRGRKTLLFASGVQHSLHLRDRLRAAGFAAEHIDGTTSRKDRDAIHDRLTRGELDVVTNANVYVEGTDIPAVSCIIDAQPTKSFGRYRQKAGRGLRPSPGKTNCIARDSLVLTDRGLVPIQNVSLDHKVWDGVAFVKHGGAICRGKRPVVSYCGITATPDHKVMTPHGWLKLEQAINRREPLAVTGIDECPVRFTDDCIQNHARVRVQPQGGSAMRAMWTDPHDALPQHAQTTPNCRLPTLQSAPPNDSTQVAVLALQRTTTAVQQSRRSCLGKVREARNPVSLRLGGGSGRMGESKSWASHGPEDATGSDQQRRTLRTRKSSLDNTNAQHEQHASFGRNSQESIYSVQDFVSGNQIRGCHTLPSGCNRNDGRADHSTVVASIPQTEGEVWDILNAGPLQRFTVNGRLVHNCVYLDHAGNVYEHGRVEERVEWRLTQGREPAMIRDKEHNAHAPVERGCEHCGALFSGHVCPKCGQERTRKARMADTLDGVLTALEKPAAPHVPTPEEMQRWYQEALGQVRAWGKKDGMAAYAYQAKFGNLPPYQWSHLPAEQPSDPVRSYLRSRLIRAAKSVKAYRLSAA